MKVGIISADPRKVCWKTYFYHGIWRRCRVSCEPPPWWTPPLNPWYPPPTLDYEANVLPPDNPDYPMVRFYYDTTATEFISGGLYVVHNVANGSAGYGYRFTSVLRAYNELHVRASVPYWSFPCVSSSSVGVVRFLINNDESVYIESVKKCSTSGWHTSYLHFKFSDSADKKVAFSNDIVFDVIRRPSTTTWDFYLNGVLVYSRSFSSIFMDRFSITDFYGGTEVGLDYFRIYVDKSADS